MQDKRYILFALALIDLNSYPVLTGARHQFRSHEIVLRSEHLLVETVHLQSGICVCVMSANVGLMISSVKNNVVTYSMKH